MKFRLGQNVDSVRWADDPPPSRRLRWNLLGGVAALIAVGGVALYLSDRPEPLSEPCTRAVFAMASPTGDPIDRFFESENAYREAWENAEAAGVSAYKNAASAVDAESEARRARSAALDDQPLDVYGRFAAARDALATIAEYNRLCLGEEPYGTYEELGVTELAQSVYDTGLPICEMRRSSLEEIGTPWELQESTGLYTSEELAERWPSDKKDEWLRDFDRDSELCAPLHTREIHFP